MDAASMVRVRRDIEPKNEVCDLTPIRVVGSRVQQPGVGLQVMAVIVCDVVAGRRRVGELVARFKS